VPFIGFVCEPRDANSLAGETIRAEDVDLTARMLSNGQTHRALPLTASLCMAVAARIEGSIVHRVARTSHDPEAPLRIGMPSGVLMVAAKVESSAGQWVAEQGAFYRTARRLFDGAVYVRASRAASFAGTAARAGEARDDHPVRDAVASSPSSARRGA
jgi:2-methylaconitate cis-trans-isomerase PrpF